MSKNLKEALLPLLEREQVISLELPTFDARPDDDPDVVRLMSESHGILSAMFKLLYDDYCMSIATKLGQQDFGITSVGRLLAYQHFADPLNHLHHTLSVTFCRFEWKKTRRPMSREKSVYECRSIARRLNARLAEEEIPLFVFVEME